MRAAAGSKESPAVLEARLRSFKKSASNQRPFTVQARMIEEKARLSSTRVQPDDARVLEAVRISGQALGGAHKVFAEDLLKKPRINHGQASPFCTEYLFLIAVTPRAQILQVS